MVRVKHHIFQYEKTFEGVELSEPFAVNPHGGEMPPFWDKGYSTHEEAYRAIVDAGLKGDFVILPVYSVI